MLDYYTIAEVDGPPPKYAFLNNTYRKVDYDSLFLTRSQADARYIPVIYAYGKNYVNGYILSKSQADAAIAALRAVLTNAQALTVQMSAQKALANTVYSRPEAAARYSPLGLWPRQLLDYYCSKQDADQELSELAGLNHTH